MKNAYHLMQSLLVLLGMIILLSHAQAQETESPDPDPQGQDVVVPEMETMDEAVEYSGTEVSDFFVRDTYRLDSIICPFKASIDYEPGDIDCFLLEVPENREATDSRMIELHVVRLNARAGRDKDSQEAPEEDEELAKYREGLASGEREDPVVYLTGGPGAAVTYYVDRFKDHTLIDHRDLYILEQRGIGSSDDFCLFYGARNPAQDHHDNYADYLESQLQNARDCARNASAAGVDLSGYSTIENARDVKALRRSLEFENWNVWGISYGSILGQAYLKEDPEGIRAVVLDAIMPLEIRGSAEYWRVLKWYVRDLQKLQEICNAQEACAEHYPDILGRIRAATQSVMDGPIAVEVKDTEVFPDGMAYLHRDIVALLPFTQFYEQSNYPGLPGLIYAWADAVERRDEHLFNALAGLMGEDDDGGSMGMGMRMAILCLDGDNEALAESARLDQEEYPILASMRGTEEHLKRSVSFCAEEGMAPRNPQDYAAVQTDIPTLIIEGDMDPITPPPNAKAILPGFSNGTYIEFAYAGHGPSRSVACAGPMMNKFFDDPGAAPDLACAEDMETPQLWAPLFETSIGPRLAALYVQDKKKLALPLGWAGTSLTLVLIAFVFLTAAPIARTMERRKVAAAPGARTWAWLSSALAVSGLVVLGAGVAATAENGELVMIFGLVPWARYGAWLVMMGGVAGLITLLFSVRARRQSGLPFSSMLGMMFTGLAAIGLAMFFALWGLAPW